MPTTLVSMRLRNGGASQMPSVGRQKRASSPALGSGCLAFSIFASRVASSPRGDSSGAGGSSRMSGEGVISSGSSRNIVGDSSMKSLTTPSMKSCTGSLSPTSGCCKGGKSTTKGESSGCPTIMNCGASLAPSTSSLTTITSGISVNLSSPVLASSRSSTGWRSGSSAMHAGDGAAVLRCTARGRRRVGRKLCTANTGAHKRATRAVWLMVCWQPESCRKRV